MNRYKLSKVGVNANEGIARFGGKTELYEKFLTQFPKEPYFRQMLDAINKNDAQTAFVAAHALKGEVGNLSMNRLYDHLCPLVEELRNGSLEKADELLKPVVEAYNAIIATLSL